MGAVLVLGVLETPIMEYGHVSPYAQMSHSLDCLKGAIKGSIMGLIYGDTWNLDYSSERQVTST